MWVNAENKSIVFSDVELRIVSRSIEFLASGIPDKYDIEDLDEFIDFVTELDDADDIRVDVRSYVFGNGESDHANEDKLEYIKAHRKEIEDEYGINMIQSEIFSVFYEPCKEYED